MSYYSLCSKRIGYMNWLFILYTRVVLKAHQDNIMIVFGFIVLSNCAYDHSVKLKQQICIEQLITFYITSLKPLAQIQYYISREMLMVKYEMNNT